MLWDVFMSLIYLTCYCVDPLIYSYDFKIMVRYTALTFIQRFCTYMIILDMILTPFTA